MITRLLPEQVSNKWDILREGIKGSIPPQVETNGEDIPNNILHALLEEKMYCWVLSEGNTVFAIVTTAFTYDEYSGVKNLLIYNVYGYRNVPQSLWKEAFQAVSKFAESKNCNTITAFTENKRVVQLVNQLGGDTETTFVKLNLNKE